MFAIRPVESLADAIRLEAAHGVQGLFPGVDPASPAGMAIAVCSRAMPVADLLRHERERRGLTLEQLADETKIPLGRLAAFEDEGLSRDGGFYQRAQIRSYAHALSLDERQVLEQLDQEVATAAPAPPSDKTAIRTRRFHLPAVGVTIGCAIAAVLIGSALLSRESRVAVPAVDGGSSDKDSVRVAAARPAEDGTTSDDVSPASVATAGTVERAISPALAVVAAPVVIQLVVTSRPEGARVTVDGIGWGVTPLTIRHLPAGPKRIRVTSDGYAAAERLIQVDPSRTTRVSIRLQTSDPPVQPAP